MGCKLSADKEVLDEYGFTFKTLTMFSGAWGGNDEKMADNKYKDEDIINNAEYSLVKARDEGVALPRIYTCDSARVDEPGTFLFADHLYELGLLAAEPIHYEVSGKVNKNPKEKGYTGDFERTDIGENLLIDQHSTSVYNGMTQELLDMVFGQQ